ncbi:LolA family protein [Spirosoma sp. KUDC1026]|uniref:LolA family protein n=1 Tax=Spirosoma sp. KUDC1026 TaxID=2745947 RepID=UPI00159BEEA3|nr:outer membrane lipoprotein carrier protein LolA [Spirosoma sp. KUDC1026]QKZ15599.1 outer membrane lipoprotein carrier protein LolA [Spirosoma sp. KUDC1026]
MKNLAYILGLALLIASPAFAQKDKKAQTILDAMSQKYKSLNSYKAAFSYTGAESYKGDLTVKNEKFRLAMGDQEVFSDGKTMSTFIKETNELNIQDQEKGASELNPTQIYNLYKKGFDYKFVREQKQGGRTMEIIQLTPNKKKINVASVQLAIDKADKSIRNWLITDKNGKKSTYTITSFTPNVNVPDTYFVFDKAKHPGVEVVDLR